MCAHEMILSFASVVVFVSRCSSFCVSASLSLEVDEAISASTSRPMPPAAAIASFENQLEREPWHEKLGN